MLGQRRIRVLHGVKIKLDLDDYMYCRGSHARKDYMERTGFSERCINNHSIYIFLMRTKSYNWQTRDQHIATNI